MGRTAAPATVEAITYAIRITEYFLLVEPGGTVREGRLLRRLARLRDRLATVESPTD